MRERTYCKMEVVRAGAGPRLRPDPITPSTERFSDVEASDLGDANRHPPFGGYRPPPKAYRGQRTHSRYLRMSDGVRLAADIILPGDLPSDTRIPALLVQTRYWRATELRGLLRSVLRPEDLNPRMRGYRPFFTGRGLAFVYVDVRGTGASFGRWPYPWEPRCIDDAREVVDWIISQPWSNGKVAGIGVSYLGTTAELLLAANHPAIRAVIPMFNHPDAYVDIGFPGGVFEERFIQSWSAFSRNLDRNVVPKELGRLGRWFVKGVKPVDDDPRGVLLQAAIAEHAQNGNVDELTQKVEYRDDAPWELGYSMDETAVHRYRGIIEGTGAAMYGWGSWMDAGTADAVLRRFLTYRNPQWAIIGAWNHGGLMQASPYRRPHAPPTPTLLGQWTEVFRFLETFLLSDSAGTSSASVLHYYTMGEEEWHTTHAWPPEGVQPECWYFGDQGSLSLQPPRAELSEDRYQVDFEATTGLYNRWWEMGAVEMKTVTYGDRRHPDLRLLTYTSEPLDEDTEITGHPVVTMHLTSTEPDAAIHVYLEDVDPSGRVTYITEGQLRARCRLLSAATPPYSLAVPYRTFRREDARPMVPGEIAELTFGLLPTSVLIRRGRRIRVAVAGHDKGTFVRIPRAGGLVLGVQRSQQHPSSIVLPIRRRSEGGH